MNFYRVIADNHTYDEFSAFVVRAENKDRALEIVASQISPYSNQKWEARKLTVDGEEGVIVASFHAG